MKDIELLETELVDRIYKLFLKKYEGNKSSLARNSNCTEATIRRIFRNEQGITVNLLIRIANALDTTPSELLRDLNLKK
ncbi:helix-turn-helix transcriptional regulator [Flavobacterium sp. MC2016-06]|jgi:plasmid maintenance system antidote protein VapI|uniref:helix-turn-helix domain-containing protein n=1 Tax=Flavobacterium sp. MC2016-06 TaxID=2676308 RepID=UPI0012BADFF6|nr:helix-turn-helix transcriptional regulator [Flavobacterium sp. MC2016-06]MBU3860136.1 helix-turn-helix transcriptional regulator [Flavobacterium sp. MC2016-06]